MLGFTKMDYRDQFQVLAQTDMINSREVRLRLLFIAAPILAAYWGLGLVQPVFWFALYVVCLMIMQGLIQSLRRGYSRGLFQAAIWFNAYTALVFISLPISLWLMGDAVFQGAAVALSFGAMMHSVSHRANLPVFAWGDGAANSLFLGVVLYSLWMALPGVVERLIIASLILAMLVYYIFALTSAFRVRRALRAATEQSAEIQKMRLVGQLSGGVAHDFNNILTVVMGNLELYREVRNPTERARLVEEAYAAAQKASTLTSQLLSFSRQAPLHPEPIVLHDFSKNLVAMAAPLIPQNIAVDITIPDDLPLVEADRSQLETAVLNLILNARDAMEGGGRLKISALPVQVERHSALGLKTGLPLGDYVGMIVQDTGTGVPWSVRDRVFDPFFTTKKVGHGSGLGLSMAKGFAEQSRGALFLDSQEGQGTQVTLLLPVADAAAIALPAAAE